MFQIVNLLLFLQNTMYQLFYPNINQIKQNQSNPIPYCIISHFMYTGYKVSTINKSISSIQTKRGLSQTKIQSLQKEIDTYTRRIQQEKRKYITVQQNYNSILKQYQEEKQKLDELKKSNATGEITALYSKIKSLEGTLDKSVSLYDDTLAENNKLRAEIDRLRRDKKNYREIHKNLEEKIKKTDLETSKKLLIIDQKKNRTQNLKNEIKSVRLRNEEDKANTLRQFESLEKNYLQEKRMREIAKLNEKIKRIEIIDTQPLLKMRLKKLIAKNQEKMKVINEYQSNIKKIESAFEEIKKSSGINSLQQITNNFISSEEQNYSLYNYVDMLTQNISTYEDQYKTLEKKIVEQEIENTKRKSQLLMTPEQRSEKQMAEIKQQQEKSQQLIEFVQNVKPELKRVLLALAKSKYNDDPHKLKDYEINEFNINQRNIGEYLSDLQKYINILIQQKFQQTLDTTKMGSVPNIHIHPSSGKERQSLKLSSVFLKPEELKVKQEDNLMNFNDMKHFAQQYIKEKKSK